MALWYTKPKQIKEAEEHLAKGDPQQAMATLRGLVDRYPAELGEDRQWQDALKVLAKIAAAGNAEPLAEAAEHAAGKLGDPQALYDLGYQLVEYHLNGFAAATLLRASKLKRGDEQITTELVCALEKRGQNDEACRMLQASGLVEKSPMCRYLLIFNSVLSGDHGEARKQLPLLLQNPGEHQVMVDRASHMLARADGIAGAAALDEQDLRGWHFVVTGALLLHLSPYGLDQPMRGRYAFVQDSMSRCRDGLIRLKVVLEAAGLRPPRIYMLDDYGSQILGLAAAEILGLPVTPWHHDDEGEGAPTEPGLLIAYDHTKISGLTLSSMLERKPGQLLYSHATCWTDEGVFTADLTNFLYQSNVEPWGRRLGYDPETKQSTRSEPRQDPPAEVAKEILAAPEDDELGPADVEALQRLASAAGKLGPGIAEWSRDSGPRGRFYSDSPVKSARFP